MSLHVLADHMASKGRNGDSMLVHMTPHEVAGLQALAMKHGGTLTINPDTGLPEASFLSSLLPMLAGVALDFVVPGLGEMAGLGLTGSQTAGLLVGGATGLATGSLSKGLMAGLGAYGGFGLGEGLAGAGADALTTKGVANYADTLAAQGLEQGTNAYGEAASKLALESQKEALAKPFMERATAGLSSVTSSPEALGTFAKNNFKPLAAAAAPIMADQMVPTTTSMAAPKQTPAYIRQYVAGDRPQAPRALAPVLASDWGTRSFQDAYRAADGGIVALAKGGSVPGYADGGPPTMLTDEQLYQQTGDWNKAAALRDAQNNALNQYNWQQQAAAANAANAANLNTAATNYVASAATPTETTADFIAGANKAGIGLTAPLATALQNSGLSAGAQYALTHADIGPNENAAETYGGLKGLSNNINYALSQYNADPTNKFKTADQKRAEARAALGKDLTEADVVRATGMTIDQLFPKTTSVVPTGIAGTYGYNTGNSLTSTPGDIGMNSDGTVTVTPNIPGRPVGGFPGMGAVKDAYTAGGGSLGQTNLYVPQTVAEFNKKYVDDRMTGDSLAAYNYLAGKGGASYPTKSTATEVMKPYEEAVLGYPTDITKKKYINVNGKMVLNPDYKPPVIKSSTSGTTGTTGTTSLGTAMDGSEIPATFDYAAYLKANPDVQAELDSGTANFGTKDNLAAAAYNHYILYGKAQNRPLKAAAGGMMGYAVGGGLGSLGSYSDGGRLLKGPGDGVSDSIPATIGAKGQPARLADGEFVVPARIVSELGNGSTDAGAKKLYAMMDRVQRARGQTTGKNKVATNTRADKYLPA